MPENIRRVDYFYFWLDDRPGEGTRVLAKLKDARVNLLSFTAFPSGGGKAQLTSRSRRFEAPRRCRDQLRCRERLRRITRHFRNGDLREARGRTECREGPPRLKQRTPVTDPAVQLRLALGS